MTQGLQLTLYYAAWEGKGASITNYLCNTEPVYLDSVYLGFLICKLENLSVQLVLTTEGS